MRLPRLKFLEAIWKTIGGISLILGALASLQTLGLLQQASLTVPFFWANISIVIVLAFVAGSLSIGFFLLRRRAVKRILSDSDARWIVLACQKPQTAEALRTEYEAWKRERQRQSRVVLLVPGLPQFDDYLRRLQREGMIRYKNDRWQANQSAIEEIRRYHGGV